MNTLTAVVPFYNEEKFLEESVSRLLKYNIFETILLVDNNSNDNSKNIARNLSKENKNITLIKTDNVPGKGVAIAKAKDVVKTSHVVIHDADLEYFPDDLVNMWELSLKHENSLILGSRFIGKETRKNIYFRTYAANRFMSLFFSILNFYKISDVASCYKLMPSTFFKNVNIRETGFSIEIELLSKFLKFNKSIIEVPIKYQGRSYSEGKKIKTLDGLKYLFSTIKYKFLD